MARLVATKSGNVFNAGSDRQVCSKRRRHSNTRANSPASIRRRAHPGILCALAAGRSSIQTATVLDADRIQDAGRRVERVNDPWRTREVRRHLRQRALPRSDRPKPEQATEGSGPGPTRAAPSAVRRVRMDEERRARARSGGRREGGTSVETLRRRLPSRGKPQQGVRSDHVRQLPVPTMRSSARTITAACTTASAGYATTLPAYGSPS